MPGRHSLRRTARQTVLPPSPIDLDGQDGKARAVDPAFVSATAGTGLLGEKLRVFVAS